MAAWWSGESRLEFCPIYLTIGRQWNFFAKHDGRRASLRAKLLAAGCEDSLGAQMHSRSHNHIRANRVVPAPPEGNRNARFHTRDIHQRLLNVK
jgi:hypothetical protein